jgi:hypothetical protein
MSKLRNTNSPLLQVAMVLAMSLLAAGCDANPGDGSATGEQAAITNAGSITACPESPTAPNCPPGSFSVACKDGSHEVATVAQVQSGEICVATSNSGRVFCELTYGVDCHDPSTENCNASSIARVSKEFAGGYPDFDQAIGDKTLPYWGYVRAFGYGNPDDSLGSFEFGVSKDPNATWTNRKAFAAYNNGDVDISKVGARGRVLANLEITVPPFSFSDPVRGVARTFARVHMSCILLAR